MSRIAVPSEDPTSFPPLRSITAAGVTYRLEHQIGIGAFSKVYRGEDSWGNKIVAKVLSPEAQPQLWENETLALHRFRHPCIVHLEASFSHRGHHFLMLADAGVCVARLRYQGAAKERATLAVARSVLQALHYLHHRGYIHGDVCPNNVLAPNPKSGELTSIRLADFAFCRPVKSLATGVQMIAPWQHAPENLDNAFGTLGVCTDVYLAALVLYLVATGDAHEYSKEETLRGEPQRRALAIGTPVGAALAHALDPIASRRPSALGLWQRLRSTVKQAP